MSTHVHAIAVGGATGATGAATVPDADLSALSGGLAAEQSARAAADAALSAQVAALASRVAALEAAPGSTPPTPGPPPAPTPAVGATDAFTPAPAGAPVYAPVPGDNTAALQAWLAANRGRAVALPARAVIAVEGRVLLEGWSGTVHGQRATLRRTARPASDGPEVLKLVQGSGVSVLDLSIAGPATAADVAARRFADADGVASPDWQGQHGIGLYSCHGVTVRNCAVTGTWGDGLYARALNWGGDDSPTDDLAVESCTIDLSGRNGISLISALRVSVRNCSVSRSALHGIDGEPNTPADRFDRVLVEGCRVSGWRSGATSLDGWGVVLTSRGGSISSVSVVGCTLDGPDRQAVRVSGTAATRALSPAVTGCTAVRPGVVQLDYPTNPTVSGNTGLTRTGQP